MKKIFLLSISMLIANSPLFAWKINLKPKPDASGKIAYGITCNNGKRHIVIWNTRQTYKPYFTENKTFKNLDKAAQYSCKNKSTKKSKYITVKKKSVFCDVESPIRKMAESEMVKAKMTKFPTKEAEKHCMTLRQSIKVKVIKHYIPKTFNRKFHDDATNKSWTVKTKYNDTYYKISDGKEYFYVLGNDVY